MLDTVVSSSNLTGALVANLDDDPDAPDADWATATALGNTEVRTGFATPSDDPVTGAGLQEFRVLLRKDAAAGTDPTYDIELWETGGGAALATLASAVTLTSEVGTVVSVTWDASLLGTADGSAVELRIVGTASVDRSVEVGAVEWDARLPGSGADLYFLRARYYDPATGRFIGRDPIEFAQQYAYAGNNPVAFTDPSGLEDEPSFGDDYELAPDDVFVCRTTTELWDLTGEIGPVPTFLLYRFELRTVYQRYGARLVAVSAWAGESHLAMGWHVDWDRVSYGIDPDAQGAFAEGRLGAGGANPFGLFGFGWNADVELSQRIVHGEVFGGIDVDINPFQFLTGLDREGEGTTCR